MNTINKKDIQDIEVFTLGNIDIENVRIDIYKDCDWLIASGSYNKSTNKAYINTECDFIFCPDELTQLIENKKLKIY